MNFSFPPAGYFAPGYSEDPRRGDLCKYSPENGRAAGSERKKVIGFRRSSLNYTHGKLYLRNEECIMQRIRGEFEKSAATE